MIIHLWSYPKNLKKKNPRYFVSHPISSFTGTKYKELRLKTSRNVLRMVRLVEEVNIGQSIQKTACLQVQDFRVRNSASPFVRDMP